MKKCFLVFPHNVSAASRRVSPVMRRTGVALLCALMPWAAAAAPQPPTATELMDWAQAQLSTYFPGVQPDVAGDGFVFRGPYPTGHFMGVAGTTVYVMGPATGGQLLPVGTLDDLACAVKPASCQPSDAVNLVNAYLARVDAMHATDITSSAVVQPLLDACYLNSGMSRTAEMTGLDNSASARASLNRKRGSSRRNAEILAERHMINPDGSARREIDVRYELVYADGAVQTTTERLIQGSSAGTKTAVGACATPQVSQELRSLGNQRIVGTSVTSISFLLDRYKLVDGTPLTTAARQYRSEIRFNILDPGGHATYATISGPGIVGSAYKMVSPRLLRSAPEFVGKIGNFVDWSDTDTFKACRNPTDSNYADAAVADCTTNGAASNVWRATNTTPATVDASFATYGFQAGGQYTIKVYNDDGWKTVNGQANKTPLATYTTRLNRLPASAAELAAMGTSAYPSSSFSKTPVEIAAMVRAKAAGSLGATEVRKAMVSSASLPWTNVYYFVQGATAASTASNFYPASRFNPGITPAVGATTTTLDISAGPAAMTLPTYGEVGMVWDDLSGFSVRGVLTFE